MLIASQRHTSADLKAWKRTEDRAIAWSHTATHRKRVAKSRDEILSFTGAGPCYAGTSWGKDSVCLAHMVTTVVPRTPLVWVRVEPDYNPDCLLVRDAFLAAHHAVYDEIVVDRGSGEYQAHGTLGRGASIAGQRHGARYLSGVRAEESGARKRRMMAFGASTKMTCAPLGWWTAYDVFAYLVSHRLPIHPAYACTMGGALDPGRIRVSPLGGARGSRPGDGRGRAEWERRYYGECLRELEP